MSKPVTEVQEAMKRMRMDLPSDLAVTVSLTIRLYQNGAMSVDGPTGDPAFCKKLLEEAWDAIKRNQKPQALVVPCGDVESRAKKAYR